MRIRVRRTDVPAATAAFGMEPAESRDTGTDGLARTQVFRDVHPDRSLAEFSARHLVFDGEHSSGPPTRAASSPPGTASSAPWTGQPAAPASRGQGPQTRSRPQVAWQQIGWDLSMMVAADRSIGELSADMASFPRR